MIMIICNNEELKTLIDAGKFPDLEQKEIKVKQPQSATSEVNSFVENTVRNTGTKSPF